MGCQMLKYPRMGNRLEDSGISKGRRSFFRHLLASAIEEAEKVGKELVQKRLSHFNIPEPTAPYAPSSRGYYHPELTVYGPPWPPPYGPYVSIELRKQLDADPKLHPPTPSEAQPVSRGQADMEQPA